jgi:hypothetical protein
MAWFLPSGTNCLSNTSVSVQGLLRAGNKSRYTKFHRKQVSGPGLSCITMLSKWLNAYAINVTNLLILLSVLGVRSNFYLVKQFDCLID